MFQVIKFSESNRSSCALSSPGWRQGVSSPDHSIHYSLLVNTNQKFLYKDGLLRNMKLHKSMAPEEMNLLVSRELADEFAKPLSIMFEKLWQSGQVPADWTK